MKPLGAGGMGEVYLAEDTRLDRKVALKVLPAEFTQHADRVRRFMQEAKAASALNHPNIITVHDIGESEAGHFIVMELVAGRTLRAVIAEDNSLATLLTLGAQIAKALAVAHAAGITHRDIKPDNIMVRDDGYVKILDFGLARLVPAGLGEEAATLAQQTRPGQLMGTIKYMSPEQARGEAVSQPSDIFSLGLVFYELATGRHPFPATSLVGLLNAIIADTPGAPSHFNPRLPLELERLILEMLDKEARRRPMAAEVEACLEATRRRANAETLGKALRQSPRPAFAASAIRHTVGREPERLELRMAFKAASAGRGSLLCVAGEPGIGKTTLVEDFLTELVAENLATMARGRCSERLAGTEAYLPLLEALDALVCENPMRAAMMRQLAPTWYAQVASISGDEAESKKLLIDVKAASQERMKRELAAFLQAIAQPRPLVIFFDDLHWADVSTIDLLNFLAGKFDSLKVLIVVTYRPSDMLLCKHPFLQIKPDLQARGVCRELQLEFLTETEIAEYLALEFPGHHFPAEFPKLIHAKTEGSPLFMADLVRYLRDREVIANASGAWMLTQALPDIERELPESVRGMIERKIAQLGEEDRRLLSAASVQGYEFDSAVLAHVLNINADEVEERLDKLERVFAFVKLVSESEFPNRMLTLKYRFVHVLYQNTLYASLRATRRASLNAAVAQGLEAFYGAQSAAVANELALLWEAAREHALAADYFLQAARNAAQVNAHREVVQLAEWGLAGLLKLPETAERDRLELDLQLTLGLSVQAVSGWTTPAAETAFSWAQHLCERMSDDPRLFTALLGLAVYHTVGGELVTGQRLIEQMVQLAERLQDSALLVTASSCLSIVLYYQGKFMRARAQQERALALDRREYHQTYLAIYGHDLGVSVRREVAGCLWIFGYPDQAQAVLGEAVTLAEQLSHPFTLGCAYRMAGIGDFFRRDWPSSRQQHEKVMMLAEEYGLGDYSRYATVYHALALAYLDLTRATIEQAEQAIASMRAKGVLLDIAPGLAALGELYGKLGQITEGLKAIAEAVAIVEQTEERYWEAEIWRVKGELILKSATSNSQAEAESCYHQAIEIACGQQAKSLELRATTSLARLWQQQGKAAEARQMLAEIYNWFTEGFDTADLKDAKTLLEELRPPVRTGNNSDSVTAEMKLSPSIAVLPFINISNDPDNEYFCDGLAEELLNALSKINALRVAARTSAFSFKGKDADIREIGQRLNVGAVLEGSVRKSDNRLRITAQLINVKDGYHLWSERYDRELKDIFDIQDEITLAIVDALKVKLLGVEMVAVTKRYTENTEAYQLYLLGRFHYSKYAEDGFRKSIEYYEQAIAIEPDYAPAFASIAMSYLGLWYYGHIAPDQSVAKTRAAADRALALDQSLAESHYALAELKAWYDWDWLGAEREFKQSLELNSNYAEAHEQYGVFLSLIGQPGLALAEAARALELAPLSLQTNLNVGWTFLFASQPKRLLEQSRKLIELEPKFFGGHWLMETMFWLEGKYEQALNLSESAVALGGGPQTLAFLGCLYGIVGNREQAQQALDKLQPPSEQRYAPRFDSALIYAGLGEWDRAFELFEEAYEQREGVLVCLKHLASLIPGFSDDPRLADLLRRIGLPQ
ncbi:MAG: protein kinase domain-containing protein [Blastocatellia bacterium]